MQVNGRQLSSLQALATDLTKIMNNEKDRNESSIVNRRKLVRFATSSTFFTYVNTVYLTLVQKWWRDRPFSLLTRDFSDKEKEKKYEAYDNFS